jgi:hypothetical protein
MRRWSVIIPAIFLGLVWFFFTARLLCFVFFIPAIVSLWTLHHHERTRLVLALWIAFALSPLCPIGFSLHNLPGPPRFVPLAMGKPGHELLAAGKRGEVLLGGCIVTGFEPRWVWVW